MLPHACRASCQPRMLRYALLLLLFADITHYVTCYAFLCRHVSLLCAFYAFRFASSPFAGDISIAGAIVFAMLCVIRLRCCHCRSPLIFLPLDAMIPRYAPMPDTPPARYFCRRLLITISSSAISPPDADYCRCSRRFSPDSRRLLRSH